MNIVYQNRRYKMARDDRYMEPMSEGATIRIPLGSPDVIVEPTDAQWFLAEITETIGNKATSFWLKRTYAQCAGRDPVDALADAKALVQLCEARLQLIKAEAPRTIWDSDSDGTDGPVLICPPPREAK